MLSAVKKKKKKIKNDKCHHLNKKEYYQHYSAVNSNNYLQINARSAVDNNERKCYQQYTAVIKDKCYQQ